MFKKSFSFPLETNLYIGCPGAGKTTLAAKIAKKYIKHGVPVYSNVPIAGTIRLTPKEDLGKYNIHDAVILLDEIGVEYNNRNWKTNLDNATMDYIKRFRHYHVQINCFSQGLDFDNRFLGLSQNVYIVKKSIFNIFGIPLSKTNLVKKRIGVDEQTHQLIDEYFIVKWSLKYFFRPLYYKMFDTFDTAPLPDKANWFTWDFFGSCSQDSAKRILGGMFRKKCHPNEQSEVIENNA